MSRRSKEKKGVRYLAGNQNPHPASRWNNSMVYVEDLDRVFLFSGMLVKGENFATDLWLYDLNTNTWEKVEP